MEEIRKEHVEGWQQFLASAEQMLSSSGDIKVLLAHQLFQQSMNEQRIEALENVFLCQKDIFNLDEAATYLSMSKSTLYKLTSKKEIPHYKPNRFIFFERSELDKWIRSAAVKTEDQLNDQVNAYTMANPIRV
jgi:excisionase family DNA binding protein